LNLFRSRGSVNLVNQDRPARQRSLRDHNLGRALRLVAEAPGPLSRARIADATGVTRATASALVAELIAAGLLADVTLAPTSRSGRPATGVALAPGGPVARGLEVNVDYLAATAVDLSGAVVVERVVESEQRDRSPAEVLRAVKRLGVAVARGRRVLGTAVALPGLLREGRLLLAPNLGWHDVEVRRALGDAVAGNEADFAALAEVSADRRSFLHVSGDIGVGAGIVVDGALLRGSRGWAGELGHVTVEPDGPRCHCGARGCLEVYAGQEALDRDVGAAARALGIALAAALNVLDMETVVLGGAFAVRAPELLPGIRRELAERVLWARDAPPRVEVARQGPRAAALGAARSVVARVLERPDAWLVT
jgi:predicted NBD/HSP70 family sugar kinase